MTRSIDEISDAVSSASPSVQRRVKSFARAAQDSSIEDRQLVEGARQLLRARMRAAKLSPQGLPRESAWDMMLILLINCAEGGILYIKQLIIASGEAPATAMRKIDRLEEGNMLERIPDTLDQRRVIVQLTPRGREAMFLMLRDVFVCGIEAERSPRPHRPTQRQY